MKYDTICNYMPHFNHGCLQGRWRCCGTGVDVMGIIGILLLLGGVVQMGAGTYFMIVLPIFESASNIWTGAITGLVGAVFMYYGCTNQSDRRHYVNLFLSLLALVANISNLVIIVVGERGKFLSEEDKLQIDRESKNYLYKIAIWGTASTSCTILLILFMVAQFIFCGYLQPGSSKNKPVSQFQQSQKSDRFFSPSRVINSKHSSYLIPTLDDIHPHPSPNAAWVYNSDDKLHGGFYPMGFESHPSSLESGRRPAARHSSFAAAPRYAQMIHRPQRAQSFASSRDPFSLHGASYSRAGTAQLPMVAHVKRYAGGHIRRSSSMNSYHDVGATLSKKYRAIASRPSEVAVIEVGSLMSEISEHSLADALIDCRSPIRLGKINKSPPAKTISERDSNRGTYSSKASSTKGPAPQPPKPRMLETKEIRSDNRNKKNFMYYSSKEHSREDVLNEDDMSEEFCNCKSDEEEEICNALVESRFESGKRQSIKDQKQDDLSEKETLRISNVTKSRLEVANLEPNVTEKQKIANHEDFIGALKSYLTSSTFSDKASWTKLEQVLMEVLSQNVEQKHDIVKDAENQLTQQVSDTMDGTPEKPIVDIPENMSIPPKDVQKNKIILRVPSFKTTSCQTEYYRPVRKKSFSPSHLPKLSPNRQPVWKNDIDVQVNLTSSSSSGYSSPEAESKESSPVHSGPPSPTTPSSCDNGPNITIIEINRTDIPSSKDIFTPPMVVAFSPPKPFRMKSIPLARNNLPTIHHTPAYPDPPNLQPSEMTYATQTHEPARDTLLTEAVNTALVQRPEPSSYAPRIVDVVPKNRVSRHDTFCAETSRQRNDNVRTNSLSLPRVSYAHPNRPRLHRSESRSPSPPRQIAKLGPHPAMDKPQSTAAYLASLELLASHYRQQALANAKQLQMQRTMLEQRKKSEIKRKVADPDSAWLPQTIDQNSQVALAQGSRFDAGH